MKQPPSKKPTGKTQVKAPAKAPTKPAVKSTPKKQNLVQEEDEIPTHPPEDEVIIDEPQTEIPEQSTIPEKTEGLTIGGEKVDPVKALGFIESIIGTLTFRTVALVALLTVISLILFALYENRSDIVSKITTRNVNVTSTVPMNVPSNWVLSESSKQSLITLAKATNVKMVIFSDVDLKKNRRLARYYFIDDPAVKLSPLALQALSLPLPVFDYDAKNTEQMIAVLSNDFRCDPFRNTVYYRFAPELEAEFPTICRLAVPPFVGTFVGFITVGIASSVAPMELETIRLEVSRIAVEIYMNDVSKKLVTKEAIKGRLQ